MVAVDLNAAHLAVAVVAPDGNVLGVPFTVPLDLAARRHPRRAAPRRDQPPDRRRPPARGAGIVIEDLDFTQARNEGRERHGNRPSRGKRGRTFRRTVAGIPTGKLRGRLVQMTANAGLSVIVVDPAYSSRWGAQHWLAPLREHHPKATGHQRQRWCSGDAGSATGPGAARTGTVPPQRTRHGQPGATQDHPGSQARTQESRHPTRPPAATRTKTGRPHGPQRATRRPSTVRDRRHRRTTSCTPD